VAAALVAAEVGLNLARGPEACVEVVNGGAEPIERLTLSCGSSRASIDRIAPEGTARLYLRGRGVHPLVMRFTQKGNALGVFEYPAFNPGQMSAEGFKLVLRVRTNEVERFQDDSDPSTTAGQLLQAFWKNVGDSLDPQEPE
jgi:hypothetical protein